MVLTDHDIRKIVNKKDIVIHPYHKENLTGVGYDLRIGVIKPLNQFDAFVETETIIRIPPKCYCLVITEEFVWISSKLIGTLHSKGTLAAKGLFTNATNVDPNFKGQMIMSLYNTSDKPIEFQKATHTFITLIFHKVKSATKTLVGDEGTKNSTRVLHEMLTNVYNDNELFKKEINTLNELLRYMNQKSHEIAPSFETKINNAKQFFNPLKQERIKNVFKQSVQIFKFSTSNIISWISGIVIIYCLFDILKSFITNKTLSKEDSRLLMLLIVALVTLFSKTSTKSDK